MGRVLVKVREDAAGQCAFGCGGRAEFEATRSAVTGKPGSIFSYVMRLRLLHARLLACRGAGPVMGNARAAETPAAVAGHGPVALGVFEPLALLQPLQLLHATSMKKEEERQRPHQPGACVVQDFQALFAATSRRFDTQFQVGSAAPVTSRGRF